MPEEKSIAGKRFLMYIIGFLFNLSYAIPTYANSSFLAKIIPSELVGIIYTASSILAILAFVEMSGFLRRFGNLKVTLSLLLLCLLSLVGLATGQGELVIIASFLLNFVAIALINFTLDVFLEEFSSDSKTGKIRGTYFTVINSAWLIAPIITSSILKDNMYSNMYILAGLLLIPVIFMVFFGLHKIKDPVYDRMPFWKSFDQVWTNNDIKKILFINFLIQFFYAWMIIYAPLYLHKVIGFDWPTIGIIFAIMLLPFPLLGAPLGRLADRHGEKKVIFIGFIIMALSTTLIAFITDSNTIIWAAVLFMTRVGAASVEVMVDIYFFKQIKAENTNIITFARMIRPIAYIVSPIVATLLLIVFDMQGLFVFLGIFMLYGLRFTFKLKETRVLAPEIVRK